MVKWSQEQFRAGSVLLAGDRLLITREGGELILASASPQAFKPIARAQILQGVVRPYPALADGLLYVRNENTLVCLDLAQMKASRRHRFDPVACSDTTAAAID